MAVTKASVFDRVGGRRQTKSKVCRYWLQGRCNRNPCSFMHSESPPSKTEDPSSVMPRKRIWRNPNYDLPKSDSALSNEGCVLKRNNIRRTEGVNQEFVSVGNKPKEPKKETEISNPNPDDHLPKIDNALSNEGCVWKRSKMQRTEDVNQEFVSAASNSGLSDQQKEPKKYIEISNPKQCKNWLKGSCVHGERCRDLHSSFWGSRHTLVAKLEGHCKAITGIALPSGFDKLYSGGKDKCVRAWDCNNGQCVGSLLVNDEVGCLITEGPWVYVGLLNTVKAWNIQNQADFSLNGTFGQVHCLVADNDLIFVGVEDGTILVWKYCPKTNIPQPVATLKGHNGVVNSLVVGRDKLYSASRDCTIKVWGLQDLQCMQTLHGHTSDVMSLICYERFLISASLDNTVKAWSMTTSESEAIEVVNEIKVDHGVIALSGIYDKEANPIVLCSYTDNSVRLHELPSFCERGRIFSQSEVHVIETGIDGLFFTGDATGEISVWKMLGVPQQTS